MSGVVSLLSWSCSGGLFLAWEISFPKPQGELRIVDNHPLNWAFIAYNVFDHLFRVDKDGTLVPQLATGWQWRDDHTLEVTLRRGITFHNGEHFDATIVQLNSLRLVAPEELTAQATVVGKVLEQIGLTVTVQLLDAATYNRRTVVPATQQPETPQPWDIALNAYYGDGLNFPAFEIYRVFALGGTFDWVMEQPELQQLATSALRTTDREEQQAFIRQMEQHTQAQAYFLFLYHPFHLYAVNKAVEFVPYQTGVLTLSELAVTDQHWSVRKQKAVKQE